MFAHYESIGRKGARLGWIWLAHGCRPGFPPTQLGEAITLVRRVRLQVTRLPDYHVFFAAFGETVATVVLHGLLS